MLTTSDKIVIKRLCFLAFSNQSWPVWTFHGHFTDSVWNQDTSKTASTHCTASYNDICCISCNIWKHITHSILQSEHIGTVGHCFNVLQNVSSIWFPVVLYEVHHIFLLYPHPHIPGTTLCSIGKKGILQLIDCKWFFKKKSQVFQICTLLMTDYLNKEPGNDFISDVIKYLREQTAIMGREPNVSEESRDRVQ